MASCCVIACHECTSAWPTFIFGLNGAPGSGSPDVNGPSRCEGSETLPWASNPSRKKMLALSRVSTDARKKHSNTETGSRLPPNRSPDSQLPSVMKRQSEWPQRWMLSDCDGTKSNHSISLIVREDIYERVHSATGDYRLVLCRFAQILLITRVVEEEGDQSRKPRGARVGERPPYGF